MKKIDYCVFCKYADVIPPDRKGPYHLLDVKIRCIKRNEIKDCLAFGCLDFEPCEEEDEKHDSPDIHG